MQKEIFGLPAYLEQLVEHSSEVFWIRNVDYSKQLYINPAYGKIWGNSCEDLYKNPEKWLDYIYPEDRDRLAADVKKRNPRVEPHQKFFQSYRIIRPDGEIRWIDDESFAIFNENGEHLGFAGIAKDVTREKTRQILLEKSKNDLELENKEKLGFIAKLSSKITGQVAENEGEKTILDYIQDTCHYLENIIANMPGMVYWLDKNCVLLGGNSNLVKMLGLKSHRELAGLTYEQLINLAKWSPEQGELFRQADIWVMATGIPKLNIEDPPMIINGETKFYLSSKIPLHDQRNHIIGVLSVSTDITEFNQIKKAKELAEASEKAKTDFLANMSHDVNTPLSNIVALSSLLSNRLQDPEQREFVQDIATTGEQLMGFFARCIELSKLDSSSVTITDTTFSLRTLLNDILALFRPATRTKDLTISLNYAENVPNLLIGNRDSLYRVLLNLVGNAVKFTTQGTVTIAARLSQNSTPQTAIVKLTVTDTGIGIPKDKQKIIFQRMTRLIPSYQGTYEGEGIGLYIVEKLVTAMGGQIQVNSEEGKGSQFIVAAPFKLPLLAEHEYKNTDFF